MNLFFRLLWLRLAGRFRPRSDLLGPVRTPFRVWPTDLDVLRHMNNGIYLSLLDVARMDLLNRAGLAGTLKERGWFPVVTAESIGFNRSLELFQRDVSFYSQQRFLRRGDITASALVVGRFLRREGGSVPAPEVAALAGLAESPPIPGWATRLGADQERLRKNALGA